MKLFKGIKGKWPAVWALSLICCFLLSSCQPETGEPPMLSHSDLVVYTVQEKGICEPVVKEFEERTGLNVKVVTGSSEELLKTLEDSSGPYSDGGEIWDVVFGVGIETLEEKKEYWQAYESPEISTIAGAFRCQDHKWTSFSACPLVIMYNTNVVTYREVPEGWISLLEPRWKGRVAFMDPGRSDIYSSALAAAVYTYRGEGDYMEHLADNLEYGSLSSLFPWGNHRGSSPCPALLRSGCGLHLPKRGDNGASGGNGHCKRLPPPGGSQAFCGFHRQ